MDLQNANVEQVSDQLEELIGYPPSHKVCVCECVCVCACVCVCVCVYLCCACMHNRDVPLKVSAKHGDGVNELLPAVVGGISRYI